MPAPICYAPASGQLLTLTQHPCALLHFPSGLDGIVIDVSDHYLLAPLNGYIQQQSSCGGFWHLRDEQGFDCYLMFAAYLQAQPPADVIQPLHKKNAEAKAPVTVGQRLACLKQPQIRQYQQAQLLTVLWQANDSACEHYRCSRRQGRVSAGQMLLQVES
ncbi:hypothetical protein [Idiomarina xiamenensis]|uniref:PTS EIIA type-1 domain-containing protein n=1 Tax=Idiomarina xiamenensis 10-D-4 TaxID=740709 RepID=K2KJI1_9GAMM|nr:hypothetical protein [Idiomarina xiamenensis]EKE86872.1 hypothetical protein A10D4_01482 [Idiomarina xiamenensis 10-D-4]